MNLERNIKNEILSQTVSEKKRKVGIEVEGFYYESPFVRLPVNKNGRYSASAFYNDISSALCPEDTFSYSLEPGGQLEWASAPAQSLWDIQEQFDRHREYEANICNKHNIGRLYFSLEPLCSPEDIDLIKQNKYILMHNLFTKTGTLGPWMMRNTTSVQVNIDFTSEIDANEMAFVADAIQPLYSILFSNTPFMNGLPANTQNLRWKIWENTDPHRCGSLISHGLTKPNQFVDDYSTWIQEVKTIFQYGSDGGATHFDGTLGEMILSEPAKVQEHIQSALHQSFTHVRYKSILEVRAGDRPPKGYELSPAAFLLGLLTARGVREMIFGYVSNWSDNERKQLNESAHDLSFSNLGPGNKTIGDWLVVFADLALQGLDERASFFGLKNERPLLESILENLINKGPKTIQIQKEFHKFGGSLHQFLLDYCFETHSNTP